MVKHLVWVKTGGARWVVAERERERERREKRERERREREKRKGGRKREMVAAPKGLVVVAKVPPSPQCRNGRNALSSESLSESLAVRSVSLANRSNLLLSTLDWLNPLLVKLETGWGH